MTLPTGPGADPLGQVDRDGGRWRLRYERDLSHPPEKVWRALTDSRELRHWLPCDIVGVRASGAAITLPFWPDTAARHGIQDPPLHGEILRWEPPSVFEWTWDADRLRFELTPIPSGTRLRFTTWLGAPGPDPKTAAGWHACLDLLGARLAGEAWSAALIEAEPWELAYAAAFDP